MYVIARRNGEAIQFNIFFMDCFGLRPRNDEE